MTDSNPFFDVAGWIQSHATRIACSMLIAMSGSMMILGCYSEVFTTNPDDRINFSTDTLSFDTVLTRINTVTRYFKVYNPHPEFINIDEVKMTGPMASFFRINVDGSPGPVVRDVRINPNDSIYVFAEITIDPDQPESVSPFVIEASVSFTVNGGEQHVLAIAWGQNANYIPGPDLPNQVLILTCDLGEVVWDDPKPYVLYGTLLIDSCTLVLPAGTRLYVHGGIANNQLGVYNEGLIYTLPEGQLKVEGSPTAPVIIRDDRIEPDHVGAWAGIRLGPGSGPHIFSHMQLSNGFVGIYADSATTVMMDHSSIAFTDGPGFFARHASATISNCLFYENGSHSIACTYGGDYDVSFCTMANFGNTAEALFLNNLYCTDPLCSEGVNVNLLTVRIQNSIMIGSATDEVWMVDASPEGNPLFDVAMNNNIVVVDELLDPNVYPDFFSAICHNCFEYAFNDTLFVNMAMQDFRLDTFSIAERKAVMIPGITDDFAGFARDATMPDIGCYEFQE